MKLSSIESCANAAGRAIARLAVTCWHNSLLLALAATVLLGCNEMSGTPTSSTVTSDSAPSVTRQLQAKGWKDSVLLLIDVQQDFWTPQVAAQNQDFPSCTARLLQICRAQGIEVVHVRTRFPAARENRPNSFNAVFGDRIPCIEGTDGERPLRFAAERESERVFYKSTFDGFSNSSLSAYLDSRNKGHVLLAGLTTDACVLSTCFSAFNHGYRVTLVKDCCGSAPAAAHNFVASRYEGLLFDLVDCVAIVNQGQRWEDQRLLK